MFAEVVNLEPGTVFDRLIWFLALSAVGLVGGTFLTKTVQCVALNMLRSYVTEFKRLLLFILLPILLILKSETILARQ